MQPLHWVIALPLAALYGGMVRLRLALYRWGWKRSIPLGTPTIAIGNLTVGGTGKTPVVGWLLAEAEAAGITAACLSRGYGRRTKTTLSRIRGADSPTLDPLALGDEVAMLAAAHPGIPFFVGGNRITAAHLARVTDAPQLLVLDDAYQHLQAGRELNVLLVDAQTGFGNGHVLPLGPLREPLGEVRRADVVLITKSNLGNAEAAVSQLQALGVQARIFRCDYSATALRRLDGAQTVPVNALNGRSVNLLCGIARPEAFRATITALGATIVETEAQPDHYSYPDEAMEPLARRLAPASGIKGNEDRIWWLTTEKDAVKLRGRLAPEAAAQVWVVGMQAVPEAAARAFFLDRLRSLTLH